MKPVVCKIYGEQENLTDTRLGNVLDPRRGMAWDRVLTASSDADDLVEWDPDVHAVIREEIA